MKVSDLESIRLKLASPQDILSWSYGEVTKPETINYRTQRAEKDGLFCEKIFGPEKDYECYCGKYRKIRYKGIVCDRCGVEVTKAAVRRERMGHIKLSCPVSHIWFLRAVPSVIGMILDLPSQQLERIIYFAAYIIFNVNEEAKNKAFEEIEKEYKLKVKSSRFHRGFSMPISSASEQKSPLTAGQSPLTAGQAKVSRQSGIPPRQGGAGKSKKEQADILEGLKIAKDKACEELASIKPLKIISEVEYYDLSLKYGEVFEAGTGAEILKKIFEKINLKDEISLLKKELTSQSRLTKRQLSKGVSEETIIEHRKALRRLKTLQSMLNSGVRPEWMFLDVLPVLPPDLRPMVQLDGGRYASSDLNDLYRRIINRNNRLKYLLEIKAPDVIVRNEKRMLQEAVDALIDNEMRKGTTTKATTGGRRLLKSLADMLKGKHGRFRQNLLGKRVDYSGRSVIVVGPELKLSQCGLPKKMALELFKPFVIRGILEKELAYNVRGASRLIEQETDEVWGILEEVVADKLVLLNRAPTLHRLGIQAFHPLLVEEETIRVHPLVCKAFNADFDGDQMAVHLPLSKEAQEEAREIMLSTRNLLKPATGIPIVSPSQDIILGCYWLTRFRENAKGEGKVFGTADEAILAYEYGEVDLKARIKVRNPRPALAGRAKDKKALLRQDYGGQGKTENDNQFIETNVGRIIFNEALPQDCCFRNEEINSKKLEKIITEINESYSLEQCCEVLDKIKDIGFEYATLSGLSWGMDDLMVPPEKEKIIETAEKEIEKIEDYYKQGLLSKEEKSNRVIEVWIKTKSEIEKLVPKYLPKEGSVRTIVESGARGSWTQPVQMAGMKGLVINPAGQIIELPIRSSFKEGFDVLEFFISTHGARKGTADTALRTSTAGYLTRRLVDVAHEVIVSEEDCGDKEGIEIKRAEADEIGQNLIFKLVGRVALEDCKSQIPIKYRGSSTAVGIAKGKFKTIVKKGDVIDWKKAELLIETGIEKIRIRSPLSCDSIRGVCQKCYGWDLGRNQLVELGEAVGVVAAQAIGEPGTQLTMRTFHTGGVAGGGDITFGLPRVQEIFEARIPGGKGVASQVAGKVLEITPQRVIRIKVNSEKNKKSEVAEYSVPVNAAIWVEAGEEIEKGKQLCEGSLDLKELFKLRGELETQRYIIKEIQRIYNSQGAIIHDKHIEVIVRQMFSRLRIKDPGDSSFSIREIAEKAKFQEENVVLKKAGKKEAVGVPILLGISRISLTTDSFLSSASFQETSRVLIKAAIEGKEDKLRGLKENVIIGKLIPAGTGFRKNP